MAKMIFEFLDTGMGDGTLIKIPINGDADANGYHLILFDFGEKGSQFKVAWKDALKYLIEVIGQNSKVRDLERPMLDDILLSHPDGDHYNKIGDLLAADYAGFMGEELEVGTVTYGGQAGEYGDLIEDIINHGAGVTLLADCQRSTINNDGTVNPWKTIEGVKLFLLSSNYPRRNSRATNPKSLVVLFDGGEQNKVIIAGDAEREVEQAIINYYQNAKSGFLESFGLKLGHHGSSKGTSKEWIAAVKPKMFFVSGDIVWAHPYADAVCRALPSVVDLTNAHYFCCGRKFVYYNNKRPKAACVNLWYTTLVDKEVMVSGEHPNVTAVASKFFTYGTQWELELVDGGGWSLNLTYTWVPKSTKVVNFDCSTISLLAEEGAD